MRARNLKPGFFKNERLAELEPLARILFEGLWGMADREGRLEDRPKRIKAEVLPYDNCDIDSLLWSLAESPERFIVRYSVDDRSFIWIPTFLDHQAPHYKEVPSEIPPFAGELNHRPIISQSSVNLDPLNPESGILNPSSKHIVDTKPASTVFAAWKQIMGKDGKTLFDAPRQTAVKRALKVLTLEEALAAVEGCLLTPHNMGENDRHEKYNDLTLIFRDAAHWERFIETARVRGKSPPRVFDEAEEALIAGALEVYHAGKFAEAQGMVPDELWLEVQRRE